MNLSKLSDIIGLIKTTETNIVNAHNLLSRSTKLFAEEGFVRVYDGKPILLTPTVRALRKLENIIHEEMEKIRAQQILLPTLIRESLLETMNRNKTPELFKLTDRSEKRYVLGATHEEAITHLLANEHSVRASTLPSRYYQISTKFRDEAHPKHGLIRTKEFIMKDLYCFDKTGEDRQKTYNEVCEQYHSLFERLQIPYKCVVGCGSCIGGTESHEFHVLSDIGEDELMLCENCGKHVNTDLVKNKGKCVNCSSTDVHIVKGIEIGHTFNVGTKYSEKLRAMYLTTSGEQRFIEMSCYGIGLTRILGAAVEVLSSEKDIKWPLPIAPYSVCIIPPKKGSKEEKQIGVSLDDIYSNLFKHLKGDVVLDDRKHLSIGKRLFMDKKLGFPYIILIGKDCLKNPPRIELHDVYGGDKMLIHVHDVVDKVMQQISSFPK